MIKPAIKETHDKGRPKNGMFIAVPEKMKNQIVDVSPGHWRIQAALVKLSQSNLLLINSYFPVDSRNDGGELLEALESINEVIAQNDFNDVLFLGDINCDFLRQTAHTNQVKSFLEEKSLNKSWDRFEVDFTMCHEILGKSYTSTLDHFFWNEGLDDKILDAGVHHSIDNLSDHSPVYCVLTDGNQTNLLTEDIHPPCTSKPSWKKANDEEK